MRRRDFLGSLSAAGLLGLLPGTAHSAVLRHVGEAEPFDFERLKARARALAAQPWRAAPAVTDATLNALDFDRYQSIRFLPDHGLWAGEGRLFEARFFHPGYLFRHPVQLHEVVDGHAHRLAYDPAMFDYGKSGVNGDAVPDDTGFAGFKLIYHTDAGRDVAAFLGASYFRAVGGEMQFGLSARGLAVDTGLPRAEEFPSFTHFWLQQPALGDTTLVVFALLDSPSVAGAYRFAITPGRQQVMLVDAVLHPRQPIERLGVAPLTSMFQTGENDRRKANDWRPEIHDSDGLSMWTGSGEWVWRPLRNPASLRFNSFLDHNPRGFGLMQRDRDFASYQDDGVFYERRPHLWVTPLDGWGAGAVQLLELPTEDETFDNIVAFWNPAEPVMPGREYVFRYRLDWGAEPPAAPEAARVVATRTGIGGVIGQPRTDFSWRFAIDFAGGDLSMLAAGAPVEPAVEASAGELRLMSARPLHAIGGYRLMFDLKPPEGQRDPINLRAFLRLHGRALSETWLYQYDAPAG